MKTLSLFLLLLVFQKSYAQSVYKIEQWKLNGGNILKKTKTHFLEKTDSLGRTVSLQTFDKNDLVSNETWLYEKGLLTNIKTLYRHDTVVLKHEYSWMDDQDRKIKEYSVKPYPWNDTLYFFYDQKGRLSHTFKKRVDKKHLTEIHIKHYYYNADDSVIKRVDSVIFDRLDTIYRDQTIYLYEYEKAEALVRKTEFRGYGIEKPKRKRLYYYDSRGMLIKDVDWNGRHFPAITYKYEFDESGNWIVKRTSDRYEIIELRRMKL